MNLLFLLFLHHLGDVAFQPSWLIKNKKLHAFAIYEHVFVWAGIVSSGLWALGIFDMWKFFFLLVGHFIIDYIKYIVIPRTNNGKHKYSWIYPDQLAHYLQILIVYTL